MEVAQSRFERLSASLVIDCSRQSFRQEYGEPRSEVGLSEKLFMFTGRSSNPGRKVLSIAFLIYPCAFPLVEATFSCFSFSLCIQGTSFPPRPGMPRGDSRSWPETR